MKNDSKVLILGGSGLLGSAIKRVLKKQDYNNILSPRSSELDLLNGKKVEEYIKKEKPEYIFMVAGLVGGILGNTSRPADFLYQNSIMILNVLEGIKNKSPSSKILFTGSTCIYPKENPQPINENRFQAGKLEETNKGYAVAKGLGIVACELYRKQYGIDTICAMPTNMYGLNDTYDLKNGHMIPTLIMKIAKAKENGDKNITLWGSGKPKREALFSDDCADALVYLMDNYSSEKIVNIGTNFDYSIKEFAKIIQDAIGWNGEIIWDTNKPDGTFEKRTDIQRLISIYPAFSPMGLKEGLKEILFHKDEVQKILK